MGSVVAASEDMSANFYKVIRNFQVVAIYFSTSNIEEILFVYILSKVWYC